MLNVLIKLNAVQIKFKLSMGTLTSDDEQPKTMKNKNEVRGKISERKKELNRVAATRYREKVPQIILIHGHRYKQQYPIAHPSQHRSKFKAEKGKCVNILR